MDIEFLGANCLKISTKKATAFIDPVVPGIKVNTAKATLSAITNHEIIKYQGEEFIIDTPGEYEISGLSVQGIATQAHMDEKGTENAIIYKIIYDNVNLVAFGHINPKLTDEQLEKLGTVDIMAIPVGGNGYTLDHTGAVQLAREIEPKIIIPTHYADKGVKYEIPQADLNQFLEEIGSRNGEEEQDKLKIGKNTILPEQLRVVVLKRT